MAAQVEVGIHHANENVVTRYGAGSTAHGLQDLLKLFQRPKCVGGEDELQMADTLVETSPLQQKRTELEMCFGVIRISPEGRLKLSDGFGQFFGLYQSDCPRAA